MRTCFACLTWLLTLRFACFACAAWLLSPRSVRFACLAWLPWTLDPWGGYPSPSGPGSRRNAGVRSWTGFEARHALGCIAIHGPDLRIYV